MCEFREHFCDHTGSILTNFLMATFALCRLLAFFMSNGDLFHAFLLSLIKVFFVTFATALHFNEPSVIALVTRSSFLTIVFIILTILLLYIYDNHSNNRIVQYLVPHCSGGLFLIYAMLNFPL